MCPLPRPPVPQGLLVQMYPQLQTTMTLRACHEDRRSPGLTSSCTGLPKRWRTPSPCRRPSDPLCPSHALYPGASGSPLHCYLSWLFCIESSLEPLPDPEATETQ